MEESESTDFSSCEEVEGYLDAVRRTRARRIKLNQKNRQTDREITSGGETKSPENLVNSTAGASTSSSAISPSMTMTSAVIGSPRGRTDDINMDVDNNDNEQGQGVRVRDNPNPNPRPRQSPTVTIGKLIIGTGQRIQGRLPIWFHRFILITLGVILPYLDLCYFLLYFLAWQIAVWKMLKQSRTPPLFLLTLLVNFGVTEQQILRSRKLIRATTLIWTDFSIFIFSTAFSQIIFCQRHIQAIP